MVNITADTEGTVGAIRVEAGDTVAQEETLVILVADDKEIIVKAPEGGKVQKIHCEEGTVVHEGDVLMVLA